MILLIPYNTTAYDPIRLNDGTISFSHGERRAQAVKLIDGTTYFHDIAYTDTDREATIQGTVTLSQAKDLDAWIRDRIVIYFDDDLGVYQCVIKSLSIQNTKATIVLYVLENLMMWTDMVWPPAPTPAPSYAWVDRTSDTYWNSSSNCSWTGSAWFNNGFSPIDLFTDLAWTTDFRPTKMRLTYTVDGNLKDLVLSSGVGYDEVFKIIGAIPLSGVEIDLSTATWGGDLTRFTVDIENGLTTWNLYLTKIEFYAEV